MPVSVTILTPDRSVLADESCHEVELPGTGGIFGILENHTPLVSPLAVGEVRLLSSPGKVAERIAVAGGFVEVTSDKVMVTAHAAERAGEIDVERAQAARRRAEQRLTSQREDIDMARARAALARATNRLHIASLTARK